MRRLQAGAVLNAGTLDESLIHVSAELAGQFHPETWDCQAPLDLARSYAEIAEGLQAGVGDRPFDPLTQWRGAGEIYAGALHDDWRGLPARFWGERVVPVASQVLVDGDTAKSGEVMAWLAGFTAGAKTAIAETSNPNVVSRLRTHR